MYYVFVCWLWFAAYYILHLTSVLMCTYFALSPVSKCDCYVVLKLPTACACCHRTKTVKNSDTPKWNETFRFRVHSGVKVMKRVSDSCKITLLHNAHTFSLLKGFVTTVPCPFNLSWQLEAILHPDCSRIVTVMNDMLVMYLQWNAGMPTKSFFINN